MFLGQRVSDLFIGFKTKNGEYEPRVSMVIMKNLSYIVFLEMFYTFGPFFTHEKGDVDSLTYALFKLPRFIYLLNMSEVVHRNLEYYCKSWTIFEIKKKTKQFEII